MLYNVVGGERGVEHGDLAEAGAGGASGAADQRDHPGTTEHRQHPR